MKNECNIIKGLLPNYIEDLVIIETKNHIENHISSCKECKQTLEIMKEDRKSTKNNENQEEKIELKNFKKYRRKVLLLKLFSIGFGIALLMIILSFALKYYHIDSLMNNLKNKKEELIALDNYSIYTTSHHINYQTDIEDFYYDEYCYKDGNYKTISKSYGINRWRLDGTSGNDEVGLSYGRDCYVLRTETKEYYKEIWIDRETLFPIRQVQDIFGQLYDEKTITFHMGNVEEKDVKFDQEQYEGYIIENKEILYDEEIINTLNKF